MDKEFSNKWKASSQPRKQRKYRAKAPLHIKKKFVSANLSKELRKKHEKRNIPVKKGDKVKILRGKFKGKEGKVTKVMLKISKLIIENIQTKKQDGSKADVKIQPSNVQIIELNLEDKKRMKGAVKKEKDTTNKSITSSTKKLSNESPKKEVSKDKVKKTKENKK